MAKVEDCPGFETFGADVKAAREAKRLARKTLAEIDRKSTRLNSSHSGESRMPSSA